MLGETFSFFFSSCATFWSRDERREERPAEARSADRKGFPSRPPRGLEKEKKKVEAPFGHGTLRKGGAQRAFGPRSPAFLESTFGMSNRDSYFYAAIVAVVAVHIVLALFVYVAWNEGSRQWREGKQD
ncbi:hypothetical protein E2320_013087 [Naja naja]|nr:hypothetical protein E2320_013087 [Naja naja]